MRNKYPAYCLLLIEAVIQIAGGIFYDQTPQEVWALSNAILFMVPLAFGIRFGLLCLIPVAVSEIVWFCILLKAGPLLHLFSFAVTIIVLGRVREKLKRSPIPQRVTVSCILYELSLLGEETLYYGLRMLFLNRPLHGQMSPDLFCPGQSADASPSGVLHRKRTEFGRRRIKATGV